MRVAFLGTPEFAVPVLRMLVERGCEAAVFTQPDRPKGRGYGLSEPPVKTMALKYGLDVYQFERIRSGDGARALRAFAPDLMVTAAFGQILSNDNLNVPKHGCVNVHASLLPKLRGAAPIQWAIINGEEETGVTTMLTDIGVDTGDIILQRKTRIGADETSGELYDRLSRLGAQTLSETLDLLESGRMPRYPQDHKAATKCGMLKGDAGRIDFSMPAKRIHDLVRGLNPNPGAYAFFAGERVKIWRTRMTDTVIERCAAAGECVQASPKTGLMVKTGGGIIEILELQFPGGKRMSAAACLNSRKLYGGSFQ